MARFILVLRCNLQERGDFTWMVSDCEELVGVTLRRCGGRLWKVVKSKNLSGTYIFNCRLVQYYSSMNLSLISSPSTAFPSVIVLYFNSINYLHHYPSDVENVHPSIHRPNRHTLLY